MNTERTNLPATPALRGTVLRNGIDYVAVVSYGSQKAELFRDTFEEAHEVVLAAKAQGADVAYVDERPVSAIESARPTIDTPSDQVRAYLHATGWELRDGWWRSPLAFGPQAPNGVHVFAILDDRFDREPSLRDPGIREIERAESCDYGRLLTYIPRRAAAEDTIAAINAASRGAVISWLQEVDPNGCHTDELAAAEDQDPYTLETARAAAVELVRENF